MCIRDRVVIVVGVAVRALPRRHGMHSGQDEAGEGVIELGVQPTVGAVAALARRGGEKGSRPVLRIGGAHEVGAMAADALGRHVAEGSQTTALVAVLAGGGGVSTGQGEPVHVHVDLSDIHFPAADGVTLLAIGGHFAAVNIGVAVGALRADVAEDHFGVTVYAADAFMQSAQRKLGLGVVVELRHRANRLPSVDGVAVLTRDVQVAVRAARLVGRLRRVPTSDGRWQQQPEDHPFCDQTWNHFAHPNASEFLILKWPR